MHHYLLVANQTLGSQELLDAVRDRLARGPAEFWLLVPATPSRHLIYDVCALSGYFPISAELLSADAEARDQGIAVARSNLEAELQRLRKAGAKADGAVGDQDPMKAIENAVAKRRFDEIILSTLPQGVSRWLALDLPHRVKRKFDIPLTVITTSDKLVKA